MRSHALPPLHLYRHLLREVTYLPKHCASNVRHEVITRFKKHMKDDPESRLTRSRIREAHSHLRSLHAANAGVLDDMWRIIDLTTAQRGRRRRALIVQNFKTITPITEKQARASLPPSLQLPTIHQGEPLKSDWLDQWDLPKLTALAASQARQEIGISRREIKGNQLEPTSKDIPAENALGRPLGAQAARRHLRKWYKKLIEKIMAPLPWEEWEALGRLARGEDEPWENGPPPRRPMCGGNTKKQGWDWKAYAVEPVRSIERGQSRSFKARTGEQGEGPYGLGKPIGLHRYERARLWRRLYMRVWERTPTIEAVGEGGKWKIEWGKNVREVPLAMPAQMAFFEGAPESASKRQGGRGIKSSQRKKLGMAGESTT
ncbi:hypothetical protein N0V93_010090 [Gnomoniopsis smithogilvyi]|uniref:LYR motif-containing protein Cup1-like N-terminal domain-containing protein n=1 Tax=Gnomoniopsis smithogilvyi TaxID=1191159 RepID=A0A9W9CSX9_9PEZI|nr:hypothetical protein N0V93_010090 [Gnomoniopsis smithogilvyi]